MKQLPKISAIFARSTKEPKTRTVEAKQPDAPDLNAPAKTTQTHTISLRVTDEEKSRLERDAGSLSRSAYIRERLFGEDTKPRKSRGRSPVKDYEALGQVLALLGRSNLADDLNALEHDMRNGSVSIDPATALAIKQACVDIHAMRSDLVLALGLKPLRCPP